MFIVFPLGNYRMPGYIEYSKLSKIKIKKIKYTAVLSFPFLIKYLKKKGCFFNKSKFK